MAKTNNVKPKPKIIRLEFLNEQYQITRDNVDDMELFERIEDGKSITAIRQVLGKEQWEKFKASARDQASGRVLMSTLNDFLDVLMVTVGGNW